MYKIEINCKTCVKPSIRALHFDIFDNRNILFWSSQWMAYKGGYLTLPEGVYYSTCPLIKVRKKFNNFTVKNIRPERDFKHDFSKFEIIIQNNPNKCTIKHFDKLIIIDPSIMEMPYFVLEFVLMHEKGHNYYNNEFGADTWAINTMLNKGYTPHQIMRAPFYLLSEKSYSRKLSVIKKILKNKK